MSKIEFPDFLEVCLQGSKYQPAIRTFADQVGELVSANKTPFFPEYTDHGVDHLNAVLDSAVNLIPENVKKKQENGKPKWFTDADATVLIGAVLLHDIAMHLRPAGFLELIDPDRKFGRNSDDKPWHELWADYQHEARRFTDETLTNLLGREQSRGFKWVDLPKDPSSWNANTERIVGEFIRRHHPRIAHDIAHCGFPGHHDKQPLLQLSENVDIRSLEDQIGFTARSHGIDLRVASKYLIDEYDNPRRHNGAATLYLMGLLRIADYLQIERDRAPLILLNLDKPQSPVSLAEWHKHRAVLRSNAGKSSEARSFKINPGLNHSTFIQLRTLLKKMQRELDQTNAVLAQELCDQETKRLRLSLRSIESDLDNRRFLDSLPYFPEETRFAADPNILPLLVEPLYGDNPSVGVRELLQNAVDAVRERRVLCEKNGTTMEPIAEADDPDTDILVDYIESPEGQWTLRIQDRGIGMTPETIRDYFLKAGASLQKDITWNREYLDDTGTPRFTRVGRFGIGIFAVFLLGECVEVSTRSYHSGKESGYKFEAKKHRSDITISKNPQQSQIGTTISIILHPSTQALDEFFDSSYPHIADEHWYTASWPVVSIRIKPVKSNVITPSPGPLTPLSGDQFDQHFTHWNNVPNASLHYTAWSWDENLPQLTVNGFIVAPGPTVDFRNFSNRADDDVSKQIFSPSFLMLSSPPRIACEDRTQKLPLLANRFGLDRAASDFFRSTETDCICSILAFALVHGPTTQGASFDRRFRHPLQQHHQNGLNWVTSKSGFCIFDGAILPHLQSNRHILIVHHAATDNLCRKWSAEELSQLFHKLWNRTPLECCALSFHEMPCYLRDYWDALDGAVDYSRLVTHQLCETRDTIRRRSRNLSQISFLEISEDAPVEAAIASVALENDLATDPYDDHDLAEIYSFLEITFLDIPEAPQSMIAKVWNETIGPNVIPYNPDARRHLIEQARKHPDMRRHLEKWERLGPTGEPLAAD